MPVPANASCWAVADLTVESTYLAATPEQLGEMLFAKGERPIRLVKTNAQPILLLWEIAAPAAQGESPPDRELQARLTRIRGHARFRDNLALALAGLRLFADLTLAPTGTRWEPAEPIRRRGARPPRRRRRLSGSDQPPP